MLVVMIYAQRAAMWASLSRLASRAVSAAATLLLPSHHAGSVPAAQCAAAPSAQDPQDLEQHVAMHAATRHLLKSKRRAVVVLHVETEHCPVIKHAEKRLARRAVTPPSKYTAVPLVQCLQDLVQDAEKKQRAVMVVCGEREHCPVIAQHPEWLPVIRT